MNVALRYIFRQLCLVTLFSTGMLALCLWLTQSIRFIDLVLTRGFSLTVFFKFILFLLPDLIVIILPVALLISILFVYNRLLNDSELLALKNGGLSNFELARGGLLLAGLIALIMYGINFYFLPLSFQKFKTMEHEIREKIGLSMIRPGEFHNFKHITLYVKKRNKNGEVFGILLQDARSPQHPITIMAEKGLISPNTDLLTMFNGTRQESHPETGKPSILWFKEYSLNLSSSANKGGHRQLKPYERFMDDLLNPKDVEANSSFAKRLLMEAHQRLLIPLMSPLFALTALNFFLRHHSPRQKKTKKIMAIIVSCLLSQLICIFLLNLSHKSLLMIGAAYFFVAAWGAFLIYTFDRPFRLFHPSKIN